MNQFLTKYIELKQAFEITDCSPTSVRDLYDFREQLSHIDDLQAKMVLVDVLNLLWFKKSAYELYRSIKKCSLFSSVSLLCSSFHRISIYSLSLSFVSFSLSST